MNAPTSLIWEAQSDGRGQGFNKKQHVANDGGFGRFVVRACAFGRRWEAIHFRGDFTRADLGTFAAISDAKAAVLAFAAK